MEHIQAISAFISCDLERGHAFLEYYFPALVFFLWFDHFPVYSNHRRDAVKTPTNQHAFTAFPY
jgi:hypothetical protein